MILTMRTVIVTRPAGYAFRVGDPYHFEHDGQHFDGVVRDIGLADERHMEITLEMSTGEYRGCPPSSTASGAVIGASAPPNTGSGR